MENINNEDLHKKAMKYAEIAIYQRYLSKDKAYLKNFKKAGILEYQCFQNSKNNHCEYTYLRNAINLFYNGQEFEKIEIIIKENLKNINPNFKNVINELEEILNNITTKKNNNRYKY